MILNVKLKGSPVLESHEIRPLLYDFAPEAVNLFTDFLKHNFSLEMREKYHKQIFRG